MPDLKKVTLQTLNDMVESGGVMADPDVRAHLMRAMATHPHARLVHVVVQLAFEGGKQWVKNFRIESAKDDEWMQEREQQRRMNEQYRDYDDRQWDYEKEQEANWKKWLEEYKKRTGRDYDPNDPD